MAEDHASVDTSGADVPQMAGWTTDPTEVLDPRDPRFRAETWAERLRAGDKSGAIEAFVEKLRSADPRIQRDWQYTYLNRWRDQMVGMTGGHHLDPDLVADLHFIGAYGAEHQYEDQIDWRFDPPGDQGSREYVVQINRHYQWGTLADAYAETGDAKYARAWERELLSWMEQMPPPPRKESGFHPAWHNTGLTSGIRTGWTWPHALEVFRKGGEHVSDRALWLMVCAFREQGLHLLHHPQTGHHNRQLLETIGLTTTGLILPELRFAEAFRIAGVEKTIAEAEYQFYPDGSHLELAPAYAAMCLANLYTVIGRYQNHEGQWPKRALGRLGAIGRALTRLAAPDGHTPALHDSPRQNVTGLREDLVALLGEERFGEPAWLSGEDDLLQWGGYAILRSPGSRAEGRRYAMLDGGPWGISHRHDDAMQVITFAGGKWFTIDPGKPRYNQSAETRYLRSSRGHNVVSIDNRRHRPASPVRVADQPAPITLTRQGPVSVSVTARQFVTKAEPKTRFDHERVLVDLEEVGWLVFDRLMPRDEKPHTWRWAWHFEADRLSVKGKQQAQASFAKGPSMHIETVAARAQELRVCAGEREPRMCGWRSEGASNKSVPTPTLVANTAKGPGTVWAVTLLAPSAEEAAGGDPAISLEEVTQSEEGRWTVRLTAPEGTHRLVLAGNPQLAAVEHRSPSGEATHLQIEAP